jgi:hypothetical protein
MNVNLHPHFAPALPDLGEILYKISEHNALISGFRCDVDEICALLGYSDS